MAKILLVEDDNNLREIYEARLQAEGYDIVSARDGEEALTVAMKERPDLIISDVMMPKISGFDMLDIIRSTEETKNVKVIMMTALSQAEDKERASKLGADRYLVKSQVTLEDVAKVAREVLSGDTVQSSVSESTTPLPVPTETPVADASPATSVEVPTATPPTLAVPEENTFTTSDTNVVSEPETPHTPSPTPNPMPEASSSPALTAITPTPANNGSNDDTGAQTVVDEQSAIAAQIESFIESKKTEPEPTPNPVVSLDQSPATTEKPDTVTEEFTSSLPEPEVETESTDDDNQKKTSLVDSSTASGKKVIQPISDPTASKSDDLEKLLKKEVEKVQMAQIAKSIATDKSNVVEELTAEAALRSAARNPEISTDDESTSDTPELAITENGDLEVKAPPSQTQTTQDVSSESIETTEVPIVDNQKPIIPHSNGDNIDGVVQPVPPASATPVTAPVSEVPSADDPNSIAL
jgi:CheY-like chemotaxis protein